MKRLLIAFAAAVAVLTASARITDRQSFEESFSDFVPSIAEEDSSDLVAYNSDAPGVGVVVPYDFENYGSKYLSLDTGDATLWRTNADEAAYFDMVLKFTPTAAGDEPTPGAEDKILVFMDADTNLVVISGTAENDTTPVTNTVTTAGIGANEWARLSISAAQDRFLVYVNGTSLNGATGYHPLVSGTTIKEVGFSGSGALDNFIARTTDPFIQSPAVQIGGEGYASLEAALDDAGVNDVIIDLCANNSENITLAAGQSFKLRPGTYTYSGTVTVSGENALTTTTADGVTTYASTAGVASIYDYNTNKTTWYATFAEAYAAAHAITTGGLPILTFKVDEDFVPEISTTEAFTKISVVSTTTDPVTVNLKNAAGTHYMYALTAYDIPANVTLVLAYNYTASGSSYLTGGGTLEIPAGVTVTMSTGSSTQFNNLGGLVGEGTIVAPTEATPLSYFYSNAKYQGWFAASTWQGTVVVAGGSGAVNPNNIGNADSTVAFSADLAADAYFGPGSAAPLVIAPTIRLDADVTIKNGFSKDDDSCLVTFTKLTGDHSLTTSAGYNSTSTRRYAITTLDAFSGTLNLANNSSVNIGTVNVASAPAAGQRVVAMTLGTGATVGGDLNLTVNGAAAGTLVFDANGANGAGLYVPAVAQIGETKYATLKEAVDAATAGQTVVVLADCTVTNAAVYFNYGITVSNDYVITLAADYTLRFANGTVSPVTFCGTGTVNWGSGSGSPFLVGNNEQWTGPEKDNKGKGDYGMTNTFSGSLVLESGTLGSAKSGGNMVKVENGTFVMNGGTIDANCTRCVKADADVGAFTASVTINGGVIRNTAASPIALMSSAESSTGTASVTINGGDITGTLTTKTGGTMSLTIPGTSTARFDRDQSTFCAAGYATSQSGDWYVVGLATYTITYNLDLEGATNAVDNIASYTINTAAFSLLPAGCEGYTFNCWTNSAGETVSTVAGGATGDVTVYASWTADEPSFTPPQVSPGTNTVYDCGTVENAAAACAAMNDPVTRTDYIKSPNDPAFTGEAAATYASYFTAKVDGTSVVLELNAAGTNALETAATNIAAQIVSSANLADVLSGTRDISISGAQPGFYYTVVYATSLTALSSGGTESSSAGLAGADGSLSLPMPYKTEGATAGFYRVKVYVTAPQNNQ